MSALPVISGRQLVKYLTKEKGFYVHHQTGSHLILKSRDEQRTLSVPQHDELRKGTLMAILEQAGITRDQFVREWRK